MKLFSKPAASIGDVDPGGRGYFSAGQKNVRRNISVEIPQDTRFATTVRRAEAILASISLSTTGSLQIVAIDPPETAYVYSFVAIPGRGTSVAVKDNYAFETTSNAGLQIIKLWD